MLRIALLAAVPRLAPVPVLHPIAIAKALMVPLAASVVRASLVPRYHWQYGLLDAIRGVAAAVRRPGVAGSQIEIEGVGDCFAVRSGRTALVVALEALALPRGAGVAVPLYCCPVVFEAVVAAGFHPVFVDVDADSYCMSASDLRAKRTAVSAVVPVHMFGNVCNVEALRRAAGDRPVVEDCAQAIGSSRDGRCAGTFGDLAIFSFRCGKYVSAGEGGAVYAERNPYRERLAGLVSDLPAQSALGEVLHVGTTCAKAALYNRPAYGLLGYRLGRTLDRRMNLTAKRGVSLGCIRKSDLAIARVRLRGIAAQIDRQRANADYYDRHLPAGLRAPAAEEATVVNRYQYPIRLASSAERDAMARELSDAGVDTASYVHDIAAIARADFGYTGDCPVAERLAATTLIIPSSHSLDARTVAHIASAVNRSWLKVAGRAVRGDNQSQGTVAMAG